MSDGVRRVLSMYRPRNTKLIDPWSFVHLAACAALTLAIGPALAFLLALLWEPLEVRVLSPMLARRGIDFGHESLANSLSDVAFNGAGVVLGVVLLPYVPWTPLVG